MSRLSQPRKISIHNETSDSSKTYVFDEEDHTFGNALRYILMRNPDVAFSGYTVPHPSEAKMHVRVQTNGKPAGEVLQKGIADLNDLSTHINDVYQQELLSFLGQQS